MIIRAPLFLFSRDWSVTSPSSWCWHYWLQPNCQSVFQLALIPLSKKACKTNCHRGAFVSLFQGKLQLSSRQWRGNAQGKDVVKILGKPGSIGIIIAGDKEREWISLWRDGVLWFIRQPQKCKTPWLKQKIIAMIHSSLLETFFARVAGNSMLI